MPEKIWLVFVRSRSAIKTLCPCWVRFCAIGCRLTQCPVPAPISHASSMFAILVHSFFGFVLLK